MFTRKPFLGKIAALDWRWGALLALVAFLAALGNTYFSRHTASAHASSPGRLANPDAACAQCHAEIYKRYELTAKAQGSGPAGEVFREGDYTNRASGVAYGMHRQAGVPTLSYERAPTSERNGLSGSEPLSYFIGSGKRGRTYLFSRAAGNAKLWYEAPINWYTRTQTYAMAPAFEEATPAPLALPTDANCLHCHATGVNTALPQAHNAFADQPFEQGGVGCSSCHGDASEHLRSHGKSPMLALAKLPMPRLESICLQCHLEGDAVVYRAGKSLAQFKPGENLADTAVYFVNASSPRTLGRASSQYEGLLRSACRRASGEKLTCLTCHDPHSTPVAAERVDWFRGKCLQCHNAPHFDAARHHPEQRDCAACHMPSRPTTDISHEQTVNHDIEVYGKNGLARGSGLGVQSAASGTNLQAYTEAVDLVPVGAVQAGDRELGLAYAQLAARGNREAFVRAESLLDKAEKAGPADVAVSEQIAYLAQLRGNTGRARDEYRRILEQDPSNASVRINAAVLQARSGDITGAVQALRAVIAQNPAATTALIDLAQILSAAGKRGEALELVNQALVFDPDEPVAHRLRRELSSKAVSK